MSRPVWGNPWHGKVVVDNNTLYGMSIENATGLHPLPPNTARIDREPDSHLVYVPGTPPVERTGDELAYDLARGHRWQNKEVLLMQEGGAASLGLRPVPGYIFVDAAGKIWTAQLSLPTYITPGQALTGTVTLRAYGVFGGEPEEVQLPVTLADIGQDGEALPDNSLRLHARLSAMSSNGRQAVVALFGENASYTRATTLPVGWLMLELSGVTGAHVAALRVHRSRAETLGTLEDTPPITLQPVISRVNATVQLESQDAEGRHNLRVTPTDVEFAPATSGSTALTQATLVGSGTRTRRRTAITNVCFDADDSLVEYKLTTFERVTVDLPPWTMTVTGSASGTLSPPSNGSIGYAAGSVVFTLRRTQRQTREITLEVNQVGGNGYTESVSYLYNEETTKTAVNNGSGAFSLYWRNGAYEYEDQFSMSSKAGNAYLQPSERLLPYTEQVVAGSTVLESATGNRNHLGETMGKCRDYFDVRLNLQTTALPQSRSVQVTLESTTAKQWFEFYRPLSKATLLMHRRADTGDSRRTVAAIAPRAVHRRLEHLTAQPPQLRYDPVTFELVVSYNHDPYQQGTILTFI